MNPSPKKHVNNGGFKDSSRRREEEIEAAIERLSREPEIEHQLRDYASKRIVTIPFETLIKYGLDQLIAKPEKMIEAIKKALQIRLEYIDPNLQLSEDEPFFDIVPFEDLIIDAASLTSDYDRKLVFIKGVVTKVGQLRHKVKNYVYECNSCGKKHHRNNNKRSG